MRATTTILALITGLAAFQPAFADDAGPGCPGGLAMQADGRCVAPVIADLDAAMRSALGVARAMLDDPSRALLDADQAAYDAMLEGATGEATRFDLAMQMVMRRDFLSTIRAPHGRWLGEFANATGTLTIQRKAGGGFTLRAHAAEIGSGTWRCEFEDAGVFVDGGLVFGQDSARQELGGPNEGWTLTLRLDGDAMVVSENTPSAEAGKRPFCNGDGMIAGAYFAQVQAPTVAAVRSARK